MSGNEPGRKAGLECSLYFLFQCPSLICFFVEGKGEKGSVERKGDTSGQCESWEAVKTYKKKKKKKKKMHSIPSQVQAFLWGGLGRKFCFGNGVRPGLVPLERWVIEAGGIRWGGLGTLTQRNAVYLQIILLR